MKISANIIAIIPARGGSKRIKNKNILPLHGKPMLSYSIEHARQTPGIGRVFVSTDSDDISEIAIRDGAEVVRRPADIAGDEASSESALLHVLEHLENVEKFVPDLVVFLQATSPIRRPGDIEAGIEIIRRENADSLFSGCQVEGFVWKQTPSELKPVNYDPTCRPRRQEIRETVWEENGSIYIFKPWVLKQYNSRLGGKIAVLTMGRLDSYQIDVEKDIVLIEKLLTLNGVGIRNEN